MNHFVTESRLKLYAANRAGLCLSTGCIVTRCMTVFRFKRFAANGTNLRLCAGCVSTCGMTLWLNNAVCIFVAASGALMCGIAAFGTGGSSNGCRVTVSFCLFNNFAANGTYAVCRAGCIAVGRVTLGRCFAVNICMRTTLTGVGCEAAVCAIGFCHNGFIIVTESCFKLLSASETGLRIFAVCLIACIMTCCRNCLCVTVTAEASQGFDAVIFAVGLFCYFFGIAVTRMLFPDAVHIIVGRTCACCFFIGAVGIFKLCRRNGNLSVACVLNKLICYGLRTLFKNDFACAHAADISAACRCVNIACRCIKQTVNTNSCIL